MENVTDVFKLLESALWAQMPFTATFKESWHGDGAPELTTPAMSVGESHSTTSVASSVKSIDEDFDARLTINPNDSLKSWTDHAEEIFIQRKHRIANAGKIYHEHLEKRMQIAEDISKIKREQLQPDLKRRDGDFKCMLKQKLADFEKMDQAVKAARREWEEAKNDKAAVGKGIAVFKRRSSSERSISPPKKQPHALQEPQLKRKSPFNGRSCSPTPRHTGKKSDLPCARRVSSG